MNPDTFIVIDIELPFKCNPEVFEKIYQEEYKGKITYRFIRSGLNLSDSVGLKLNVEALLNSRYTQIFNKPIPAKNFREEKIKRFPRMYSLIITARYFFGTDNGVLAQVNAKIHL